MPLLNRHTSSKGNSRPAFARILKVATLIRNRPRLTTACIADLLEVSDKTIYRDIDFLKDLGAPIYFNYYQNAWVWNVMVRTPWYFGGDIRDPKLCPF